jgi:hypothetical protein
MTAFIAGLPGAFSTFVFDAASALVAATGALSGVVTLDRTDQIDAKLPNDGKSYLVMANFGEFSVIDSERIDCGLVAIEDPISALRFMLHQGVKFESAIRAQSQSLALLADARWYRHWPVVDFRSIAHPTGPFLKTLARSLSIKVTDKDIEQTLKSLDIPNFTHEPVAGSLRERLKRHALAKFGTHPLSENEIHFANSVLRGLVDSVVAPEPSGTGESNWPRELFFDGGNPGSSPPLMIDLTGPARCLLFGPYLCLPRGLWVVNFIVGFSDDALGMPFRIEVCGGSAILGAAIIKPIASGIFTAAISFSVSLNEPIEIRLFSMEGAIEGRVGFVRARLVSA